MNEYKISVLEQRINKTVANLKKNRIDAYYIEKKSDVPGKVTELIEEGQTISSGGSMSLIESGVIELLRSGKYNFLDRDREGIELKEREQIQRETFSADVFFCSANAVTEKGEIYNVDGNGNRVAAIVWGPKSVIMVVSVNKITRDIDEAVLRVKRMAAPANAKRLGCKTYCNHEGECMSCGADPHDVASGCMSDDRVCCHYLVSGFQRQPGRIKVILVGEELGF